jgi:3-oxoadipate enol-lactonase
LQHLGADCRIAGPGIDEALTPLLRRLMLQGASMLDHFKTSDGIRIGYYVDDFSDPWRNDPPLIMLHAAMGHSKRYYAMVPTLCRHFRTIRMDLRGHGESEVPADKSVRIERLVDDTLELMARLGIPSAHFIGNSAGGYVSQQLAMNHPDKVLSLCLFGSTPGLKNSQALTWIPQVVKHGLRGFLADTISDRFPVDRSDPGLINWFLDEAAKNDAQYIGNFVTHMASHDWSDQLHRIRCPTLVVVPGGETVGHTDNYNCMRDNIPDVVVKYYDDLPHNICDIVPERCADDALAFLQQRFPGGFSPLRI